MDDPIRYLNKQLKVIAKCSQKLAQKTSPMTVHKTRVAIRRARVALSLLNSDSHSELKHLSRDLLRLRRRLDQIGDLDVAIGNAPLFSINPKRLISIRKHAAHELRHKLKTEKHMNFSKRIVKAGYLLRKPGQDDSYPVLRLMLASLGDRASNDERFGRKASHQLRIVMKHARYTLEASNRPIQEMKPLQDILGQAHDIQVLRDLVGNKSRMKAAQKGLNLKARPLIGPTIKYAIRELKLLMPFEHR